MDGMVAIKKLALAKIQDKFRLKLIVMHYKVNGLKPIPIDALKTHKF